MNSPFSFEGEGGRGDEGGNEVQVSILYIAPLCRSEHREESFFLIIMRKKPSNSYNESERGPYGMTQQRMWTENVNTH